MDILEDAVATFAFHPVRCASIASVFTVALFFGDMSLAAATVMGRDFRNAEQ
jgi:hypothetical protein